MKASVRQLYLSAAIIAFISAIQSASAIPTAYRFWEDGWPDGGRLSGTLVIDETQTDPDFPNFCNFSAVSSFEAHWSGNSLSQPYDWVGIGQIQNSYFLWSVPAHQFFWLAISPGSPVYIDGSILGDDRNVGTGGQRYWVMSSDAVHVQAVPDGRSTLLYLGIALVCLVPFLLRQNRAKA